MCGLGEKFGKDEKDETLRLHLHKADIVQMFVARPEGDGYGVVTGRRRFLAKKESGTKEFVVGRDCWIREMSEDAALDASLLENLDVFRKELDPMTRAEKVNELAYRQTLGVRSLAIMWGMGAATLSEWMSLTRLKSEKMKETVRKGIVPFRDAVQVVKLGLGEERKAELAETTEKQGLEAFKKELSALMSGSGKRGVPAGLYVIDRVMWDKRSDNDRRACEILEKAAAKMGLKVPELEKKIILDHLKEYF